METEGYEHLMRTVFTTPSRRAISRALAGLAASSVLAPLIEYAGVKSKKKKKKKQTGDKFCRQKGFSGQYCPEDYLYRIPCCSSDQSCTPCGCCAPGITKCCVPGTEPEGGYRGCCFDHQTCCVTATGEVSCCEPDQLCCGGACCAPAFSSQCCGGTECCHYLETCCPDGRCHLACP